MKDAIVTRRSLERWAARQIEPVKKAADKVALGLKHSRPSDAPIMRRLLADDVAKLKSAVELMKG